MILHGLFLEGEEKIMGVVDYENLYKIYRVCVDYCKQENLPFQFKVDTGDYETAIEFWTMGYYHPPKSKSWKELKKAGNEIKCPDILDFEHRIIIELEEDPKPGKRMGKLGKKGHVEESKRDSNRDMLYRIAGFKVLKIWELEYKLNKYKGKLYQFLYEVYKVLQDSKKCPRSN